MVLSVGADAFLERRGGVAYRVGRMLMASITFPAYFLSGILYFIVCYFEFSVSSLMLAPGSLVEGCRC